jgi:KDO2-lipid IV(A) lauroyltransferase
MGKIIYFIFILPLLFIISILPFFIIYAISDLMYLLIYKFIGYRKHVVRQNLKNAFPEKSESDLKLIEKKYYHFLCDVILETIQTISISERKMLKRCYMNDHSKKIFEEFNQQQKSCVIVLGHFGNWEWGGNTFSLTCKQQLYVLYHPLSNVQFDGLMKQLRTRFGAKLYAMKDAMREMIKNKNETTATAFIADQTPAPETAYWMSFLNQDTPVFLGTEKIAKKLNFPVVYVSLLRKKRGYYEFNAEVICANPQATIEGEITELHTKRLEQDIDMQPETWLWSHRRWKHKRKV